MKPHLVFCHGWGLDHHYWNNLSPFLCDFSCTFLDSGYFDTPTFLNRCLSAAPLIGIGHSLGFIKLLSLDLSFKAVIGLNAFTDFLGSTPSLRRHRQRAWDHLYHHFEDHPQKTLLSFYQKCGFYGPYRQDLQGLQVEKLRQDLKRLLVPFSLPLTTPVLVISTEDDSIVPSVLTEDNFSAHSHVTKRLLLKGQHLLGYDQVTTVAPFIKDFIDTL